MSFNTITFKRSETADPQNFNIEVGKDLAYLSIMMGFNLAKNTVTVNGDEEGSDYVIQEGDTIVISPKKLSSGSK